MMIGIGTPSSQRSAPRAIVASAVMCGVTTARADRSSLSTDRSTSASPAPRYGGYWLWLCALFGLELKDVALICLCYLEHATPAQLHYASRRLVTIVVLLAFGVIFGLGTLMFAQISQLAGDLPRYQSNLGEKIQTLRGATTASGTLEQASFGTAIGIGDSPIVRAKRGKGEPGSGRLTTGAHRSRAWCRGSLVRLIFETGAAPSPSLEQL